MGFEPTVPFGTPVFKTGAINHSTTPPGSQPIRDRLPIYDAMTRRAGLIGKPDGRGLVQAWFRADSGLAQFGRRHQLVGNAAAAAGQGAAGAGAAPGGEVLVALGIKPPHGGQVEVFDHGAAADTIA